MSISEIATPIPNSIEAAPILKNFAKNTAKNIVANWFTIVASEYDIDFNCALNNCESNALHATGIINSSTASKYLIGTWNKLNKPSLKISARPTISSMFKDSIVTNVVKYLGKSFSSWCCLKNLKPDNPTQSEKIIHKNDNIAMDTVYKPYCSVVKRLV